MSLFFITTNKRINNCVITGLWESQIWIYLQSSFLWHLLLGTFSHILFRQQITHSLPIYTTAASTLKNTISPWFFKNYRHLPIRNTRPAAVGPDDFHIHMLQLTPFHNINTLQKIYNEKWFSGTIVPTVWKTGNDCSYS